MAEWYSSPVGQMTIHKFHKNFARGPAAMKHARKNFHKMMMEVQHYLRYKEGVRMGLEYTGSAYERLKVGGKELEFDVMFVRGQKYCKSLSIEKDPNSILYSRLKPKNEECVKKFAKVLGGGLVSPLKVRYWFHGMLQNWLNNRVKEKPGTDSDITIHYGGPAIRATVYKKNGSEWYFVDLVPAYRVRYLGKSELYVAKPREGDDSTWRHSFSLEEKAKLRAISKENGCQRMVIRILKVIRDREPGLDNMVSFYIKCLVIEMSDRGSFDWNEENLSKRLLDVMLEMKDCMRRGVLRHFFDKSINILQTLDHMVRQNIADRLESIATNECVATEVFNPASAKAIK